MFSLRSAGFIRRMTTYAVALGEGTLYLVAVGPAMRATRAQDPLTQAVLGPMSSGYEQTIRAGEQRLAQEGFDAMSAGKDCVKLARNDVAVLDFEQDIQGLPRLGLRTPRGKVRFQFPSHSMQQVWALAEARQRR
jgi:hypothetical protein